MSIVAKIAVQFGVSTAQFEAGMKRAVSATKSSAAAMRRSLMTEQEKYEARAGVLQGD